MPELHHKIDNYLVRLYGNDTKGRLTRIDDKEILLYAGGKLVGHASFAKEGNKTGDSHVYQDVVYFRAPSSQYPQVIDLLRNEKHGSQLARVVMRPWASLLRNPRFKGSDM